MSEIYALVNIEKETSIFAQNIDPTVDTKQGFAWYQVVDIERPSYNPKLQRADSFIRYDHSNKIVYRDWKIVELTPDKIRLGRLSRIKSIDPIILYALMDNKYSSLDEYINYLETLSWQ